MNTYNHIAIDGMTENNGFSVIIDNSQNDNNGMTLNDNINNKYNLSS